MSSNLIEQVATAVPNRRSFLKKIGAATAAVGAMSAVAAVPAEAQTTTEIEVLQFALNLEYLESEFYTYGLLGKGIVEMGVGVYGTARGGNSTAGGPVSGGKKVTISSSATMDILTQIGNDERAHVVLLRDALGAAKIAEPAINLNALGFGFGSEAEFLKLSRIFEDIGVTAYAGAAGLLTTPFVITTAARILAVEAEHVSAVRTMIGMMSIPTAPALDGVDILPPPSGSMDHYLSVNYDGLVSTRTPQQVLYLAYAAANATYGGFFAHGFNGAIYTSGTAAKATSSNS